MIRRVLVNEWLYEAGHARTDTTWQVKPDDLNILAYDLSQCTVEARASADPRQKGAERDARASVAADRASAERSATTSTKPSSASPAPSLLAPPSQYLTLLGAISAEFRRTAASSLDGLRSPGTAGGEIAHVGPRWTISPRRACLRYQLAWFRVSARIGDQPACSSAPRWARPRLFSATPSRCRSRSSVKFPAACWRQWPPPADALALRCARDAGRGRDYLALRLRCAGRRIPGR
jgi:hypothetical protein